MLQILALLGSTDPSEKDGCGVCFACVSVNDNALGVMHCITNAKVRSLV